MKRSQDVKGIYNWFFLFFYVYDLTCDYFSLQKNTETFYCVDTDFLRFIRTICFNIFPDSGGSDNYNAG
ncbi:MAG: hypothetical protein ABH869_03065 [Candidatus Omnitrophota bacterium]